MKEKEKEIGGQLELVRYQAGKVRQEIVLFDTPFPPVHPDILKTMARGMRNFAEEIENLRRMVHEYPGLPEKDETPDT